MRTIERRFVQFVICNLKTVRYLFVEPHGNLNKNEYYKRLMTETDRWITRTKIFLAYSASEPLRTFTFGNDRGGIITKEKKKKRKKHTPNRPYLSYNFSTWCSTLHISRVIFARYLPWIKRSNGDTLNSSDFCLFFFAHYRI